MNTAPIIETEAAPEGSLRGSSATYSPEDNKLRLYSLHRLDKETYERVKAAGFGWAPRQELFVAPMWTPEREDLLLELCGDIGDEDTSLVDRAEQRAERFEDYSESRAADAESARASHEHLSQRFEGGQPILVGHHSERRARKDAERIQNSIRRELKMWQTSKYWTARAAGAISHAKYKERPDVRQRRIKTLEADKRRHERTVAKAQGFLKAWRREALTLAQAKAIANYDHTTIREEGMSYRTSLWSMLDGGQMTAERAAQLATPAHERQIAHAQRWIAHLDNRLAYERAMLGDVPEAPKPPRRALAPMANYPGEGFVTMTKAEWAKLHKDYKGSRIVRGARVRTAVVRGGLSAIYLSDSKRVDPPQDGGDVVPRFKEREPELRPTSVPRPPPAPDPAAGRIDELRGALKAGIQVVVAEQLFVTPPELAKMVVERAQVAGQRVLEPSAGLGALVREALAQGADRVDCIERDERLCRSLRLQFAAKAIVGGADFLELAPYGRFDRIVMNPPFADGQDVAHVAKAFFDWLEVGGRLVAIMSAGVKFRQEKKYEAFRALIEKHGSIEDLPEGSFESSGTSVRTVLVTLGRK